MKKHFSCDTKFKYVILALKEVIEIATITFVCEFEQRYLQTGLAASGRKKVNSNPGRMAKLQINAGISKYNLRGERGLIDMAGKSSNKPGKPKKRN